MALPAHIALGPEDIAVPDGGISGVGSGGLARWASDTSCETTVPINRLVGADTSTSQLPAARPSGTVKVECQTE